MDSHGLEEVSAQQDSVRSNKDESVNPEQLNATDTEKGSYREGLVEDFFTPPSFASKIWSNLTAAGVELRSVEPVPPEKRTDTRYLNLLTILSTVSFSLLPVSVGSTTTLIFGLSLKEATAMIITMGLVMFAPSAYIATLAPLLGMRQIIQFRYVYGKYLNSIIAIVTLMGVGIFAILSGVNGAQVLASIRPGTISVEGCIAIIFAIAFLISFGGYHFLHFVARWMSILSLLGLIIFVGCAGDQLHQQASSRTGDTARPYLACVTLCAGIMFGWGGLIGDYACYFSPKAPRPLLFVYAYCGLAIPFSLLTILGAAIAGAIPVIPPWGQAYSTGGLGGVIGEILKHRLGGFGDFILVILALSVIMTCARDVYSISVAIPGIIPFLRRIPRVVFAIIASALLVGLAIPASKTFLTSLSALVSVVSYQTGTVVTVYLVEYLWFRKANPDRLDLRIWDEARALPSGISAFATTVIAWGPIIVAMDQVWFVGPIGKAVGDMGFILAIAVALVVYPTLRTWEIKYRGRF